jgi:hypothetical protein
MDKFIEEQHREMLKQIIKRPLGKDAFQGDKEPSFGTGTRTGSGNLFGPGNPVFDQRFETNNEPRIRHSFSENNLQWHNFASTSPLSFGTHMSYTNGPKKDSFGPPDMVNFNGEPNKD